MEEFIFYAEGNYFKEFKFHEEESYYFHDFRADYLFGEDVFLSSQHICARATSSESSFSRDVLALSEIKGGFTKSLWVQMEESHRKSKEGDDCEKELIKLETDCVEKGTKMQGRPGGGREKALTFEQVSRHFSMPIKQAAKELNVGLTSLKKRCRQLRIPRWPHRKVKSLQTLINNVQELGKEIAQKNDHLTRSMVEILQQTKKLIEERPAEVLDQKTKVLRQVCFKEKFKRRLRGSRHMVMDDSAC